MPSPAGRPRPELLVILVLTALLGAGCQSSGGDDQSSGFRATFTSGALTANAEVVFVRLRDSGGSLITLDVVGLSITPPLDGLQFAMAFDPSILQAVSVSDQTFLGECGKSRPDNTVLLCADSISSGNAKTTGVVIFSALPHGPSPTPATVTGERVLASITFRAVSRGISPIFFHHGANPGPGGTTSWVDSASDPTGAAAVLFEPVSPGEADVEVRR